MSATSATPNTIGISGGMDITVNGNGFGSNKDDVAVKFGTDDCVVKSVEMTKIVCTAPALADGSYDVNVSPTCIYKLMIYYPYLGNYCSTIWIFWHLLKSSTLQNRTS